METIMDECTRYLCEVLGLASAIENNRLSISFPFSFYVVVAEKNCLQEANGVFAALNIRNSCLMKSSGIFFTGGAAFLGGGCCSLRCFPFWEVWIRFFGGFCLSIRLP